MPRRLSNLEWATFLQEVDVTSLSLPAWGGAVEWGGMTILVFKGTTGEWFLTDVSDVPAIAGYPKTWDYWVKVFVYALPENIALATIATAKKAGAIVIGTAAFIGETAAAGLAPLTFPLIVLGVIGAYLLAREIHV